MEKVNVVLVASDDYEALYFNGVLVDTESMFHTTTIGEKLVGKFIESFDSKFVSQESLEENNGGDFPEILEEIVFNE